MRIALDSVAEPLRTIKMDGRGQRIAVFLTPSPAGDAKNFRCTNCGKLVFQYSSTIGLIVASSELPQNKAPIDAMCHRCGLMYRILW